MGTPLPSDGTAGKRGAPLCRPATPAGTARRAPDRRHGGRAGEDAS
ncbi:hypothetical protein SAMN05216505_12326 [Streptomyces prasinopilosus]|uniref:Uncharacterized protein n=1 Tax=Streptomyces prasinopilosus TaxID=67344 RepID=A0A1G7BG12_9ACTN|nr:hypothetical protein SAMN05216505_12326 [Streptomyces prasinopilosus]